MSTKKLLSIPSTVLQYLSPQKSPTKPVTKIKEFYSPQTYSRKRSIRRLHFHSNVIAFNQNTSHNTFQKEHSKCLSYNIQKYCDPDTLKDKCKILGRGTFGTVLESRDRTLAIKILNTNKTISNEKNLQNISHRNLVRIIDIIYDRIILMENCSNYVNLRKILFDDTDFIATQYFKKTLILELCLGIKACHQLGIVHLDIKPDNILIDRDIQVKLCDFGSSFNLNIEQDYKSIKSTVSHTAPEIFKGMRPTKKADIYSLGITLWQIHNRQMVYYGYENDYIIYNVCKNNMRPSLFFDKITNINPLLVICWSDNINERPNIEDVIEIIKDLF